MNVESKRVVDGMTRFMSYRLARVGVGSVMARNYPNWARIDITTTFRWSAETLDEVYAKVWADLRKELEETVLAYPPIAKWTLTAIRRHFGVAPRDITGKYRDSVLVEGRHMAAVCMFKAGLNKSQIGKALDRDSTTIHHAIATRGHYVEGLPNVAHSWDSRPPLD